MKKTKKSLRNLMLAGLSALFCGAVALSVGISIKNDEAQAKTVVAPVAEPRYIYDTSLLEGVLGVGSKIALPKAQVQDTLDGKIAGDATVTIVYNGSLLEGYNQASQYADDFVFKNAGTYEIVYGYKDSEETPKDAYTVTVSTTAPTVIATERTSYIVPTGTTLEQPTVTMSLNGEALAFDVHLYYPDETAYQFETVTLKESGEYELEYKAVVNETVYSYMKRFYVYGTNTQFTGSEQPYYGAPAFEETLLSMESFEKDGTDKLTWTDGLNVAFRKGDVLTYEKPIDLKELGATEKLIKFYAAPTAATTVYFYVDLVDVNDPTNVLTVRFCSVPKGAGSKSYRTYVSTAATGIGQTFAGLHKDAIRGDILYIDRLSAGTYTSVDVSGLVDTDLYYPLSFAYDEENKQVFTNLLDRESNLLVADLDDTQTHFDTVWSEQQIAGGQTGYYTKAWGGFSADKAYLRMRVEGEYTGAVQVAITKVGNHDLTPKFGSLLPAPSVEHRTEWVDGADYTAYYGAPSFENSLTAMDSYDKTTDKLTWTNGINATLVTGDSFNYPDLIDLSEISAAEKLFKILIAPTDAVTTSVYVDLIDENDPENILSVRFVCSGSGTSYRTYVSAAALKIDQPYTGYYNIGTTQVLCYNRPMGGFYANTDITGLNTSLYYPLSFAYDETSKKVLSCLLDRDTLGVVADMDDTTTNFATVYDGSTLIDGGQTGYFQTAWDGFSTNKVYLRVRMEGVSRATETTILKIGNEDLSAYETQEPNEEAKKSYYSFNGIKQPYYGAIAFEDTIKETESYEKTNADKLALADGINVTFNKTNEFYYGEPIDLTAIGATEKLFKIYVKPTGTVTTSVYVDLIDENDPENILSVRFVCGYASTINKIDTYRTYVSAAALKIGQPYTGLKNDGTIYFNRPMGGFYANTDITGKDTSLYYPLSFAYDETSKKVLSCLLDRDALGVVADMDDTTTNFATVYDGSTLIDGGQTGYFQKAWGGFSTNKVYLRVRIDGTYEEPLQICITHLGGKDLSKTGTCETILTDKTIAIDVGNYDLDDLPKAVVGQVYRLFEGSAYDITGKRLNIKTKIYYEDTGVQIAHDGVSFIPPKVGKYTVVYSVVDRYGYTSRAKYVINAVASADVSRPSIQTPYNQKEVTTGLPVTIPACEITGGIGEKETEVFLRKDGKLIKTFSGNEESVFTPKTNGEYILTYRVVDYVGNTAEQTVVITAMPQEDPIFEGDVALPDVMINGWEYELPALFATDYNGNEPTQIKACVKVYDDRNGYVLENGYYIPQVSGSKEVKIVYYVETDNGYAEKEYSVQVQKTQDGENLLVDEYFIGENVAISANANAVVATADASGAKFRFANPLLIGKSGLTLAFNVPTSANAFDALYIYLTDVDNSNNTVKLTLHRGDANQETDVSFTTLTINDGNASYRVPGSFLSGKEYELTYEELTRRITALNGVKATVAETVYGEAFEGFVGRYVYVTFVFGNKTGNACVNVTKINNQSLNTMVTSDKIGPQIAILGEYGGMASLNEKTSIMRAIAGDVLAESVSVTMTLEGPKGSGKLISEDGIELINVDASREYTFIPTVYGTYRVVFTAVDSNNKTSTTLYNIAVMDNHGPTIFVNGNIPTELTLHNGKATLTIPNVEVSDDSGKECRVVFNLKRPDGTMIRLESTEITLTAVGRYVFYIDAYDANGNQTVESFVILVK